VGQSVIGARAVTLCGDEAQWTRSQDWQSTDSCFVFLVTLIRNMVVKVGSQRQITFRGVETTTDKQTTTPVNVFWR